MTEGLDIMFTVDANNVIAPTQAAIDAMNGVASAATNAGDALDEQTISFRNATIAVEELGRSFRSIDGLTEALRTLRVEAGRATSFEALQGFNRDIQLLENEIKRLQGIGRISIDVDPKPFSLLTADIQNSNQRLKDFIATARATNFEFVSLSRATGQAGNPMEGFGGRTVNTTRTLHDLSNVMIQSTTHGVGLERALIRLVEAFDYVQRSAGGAGNAFKALWSAMLGPSGIILGISALLTLATTLVQKYGSLQAALIQLNPFLSEHAKTLSSIAEATKKGTDAGTAELVHLNALFTAAKNVNIPLNERKLIADELQRKYPSILGNLSQEAILTGQTAEQYKKLSQQILAAAQSKALEETITEKAKALNKLQDTARDLNKQLEELRKPQTGWGADPVTQAGKIERLNNLMNANRKAQKDITDAVNETVQAQQKLIQQSGAAVLGISDPKNVKSVTDILKTLSLALQEADAKVGILGSTATSVAKEKVSALKNAFDDLIKTGLKPTSPEVQSIISQINALGGLTVGTGPKVKTLADIMKTLRQELAAVDERVKVLGSSSDALSNDKLKALQKAFDDLAKIGIKPGNEQLDKITSQISILQDSIIGKTPIATKEIQQLGKAIQEIKKPNFTLAELQDVLGVKDRSSQLQLSGKDRIQPKIQIQPDLQNVDSFQNKFNNDLDKLAKNVQDKINATTIVWGSLTSGLEPVVIDVQQKLAALTSSIAEGIGESIANIAAGTETLGTALGKILSTMGKFLVDFGKSMVESATLAIIAQKSLISSPYVAIAAGIGAIAIGTALQNSVPKFADGGTAYGPQLAIVGDNTGRKEHILSDNQLDRIAKNGKGGEFVGEWRVDGSDLLLAVKRAERSSGRIN